MKVAFLILQLKRGLKVFFIAGIFIFLFSSSNVLCQTEMRKVDSLLIEANMSWRLRQTKEAQEKYEYLLNFIRNNSSIKGDKLAAVYTSIGEFYLNSRDFDKAQEYLETALQLCEKHLGKDYPEYASVMHNLAIVWKDSKCDCNKALYFLTESVTILEKGLGNEHPWLIYPLYDLGLLYDQIGQLNLSAETLIRSLNIALKRDINAHKRNIVQLMGSINAYKNLGKDSIANFVLEEALKVSVDALLGSDPDSIFWITRLGDLYYRKGKNLLAKESFSTAIQMLESTYILNYESMKAKCMQALASIHYEEGQLYEALSLAQQSLEILEKKHTIDHCGNYYTMSLLIDIYTDLKNYSKAEKLSNRVSRILKKYYPNNTSRQIRTEKQRMKLLYASERCNEWLELKEKVEILEAITATSR